MSRSTGTGIVPKLGNVTQTSFQKDPHYYIGDISPISAQEYTEWDPLHMYTSMHRHKTLTIIQFVAGTAESAIPMGSTMVLLIVLGALDLIALVAMEQAFSLATACPCSPCCVS